MKKIYSLAVATAALWMPGQAMATDLAEKPDTLLNVNAPSHVTVTENASGMTVKVEGIEENEGFAASVTADYSPESSVSSKKSYERRRNWLCDGSLIGYSGKPGRKSHWGVGTDGVCLGLTNAVGQGNGNGFQWGKSMEICWMNCLKVYYSFSRSSISLGLGFDWRNYKSTTPDRRLIVNESKGLEWRETEIYGQENVRNTRLKVFSLQFPLLYEWRIPKSDLKFKMGPVMNFNTYASVKTSFRDTAGDSREEFIRNVGRRKFTVDFYGGLSYCGFIGFYVRYSPMHVMDAPGLNFHPLTLGVSIGM